MIFGRRGFTYNFKNQDTQYQNGIISTSIGGFKFLSKQVFVGLFGYAISRSRRFCQHPILGGFSLA